MRRGFWLVVALSGVLGLAGAWSLWDAAAQYTGTLRTYRQLEAAYQPGSFAWTSDDFATARLTLVVTNRSPADATVTGLDVELFFDGAFAGSNYAGFTPFTVPRGASRAVEVELSVSVPSQQPRGGTADLTLGGTVVARFEGIRHPIGLDLRAALGRVGS